MQDTLELAPFWELVGGLRLDNFKGDFDRCGNTAPNNTPLSRSDTLLSKRLGLMYQPSEEASYYAAYGTSFNTSGDRYQFDPQSANTPPESSRNMKIGAKYKLYGGDLSVRTALARTEKFNERNTDIDTANNSYLLSGKRHNDALEFEIAGRITPHWDVFAALNFLRAQIDKSGSDPAGILKIGKNPGLSPSCQANLITIYRIGDKWRIGDGFTAVSQNKPANSVTTPNRAQTMSRPIHWSNTASVEATRSSSISTTCLARRTTTRCTGGFAAPGDARSVRLTLTSKF